MHVQSACLPLFRLCTIESPILPNGKLRGMIGHFPDVGVGSSRAIFGACRALFQELLTTTYRFQK